MLRPWKLRIDIDLNCDRAVYIQIADAIIAEVKNGKLAGGSALPGSRQLAGELGVNRNTVVEALDVLLAEGWLVSKERKGTFVAENLPVLQGKTIIPRRIKSSTPTSVPRIVFDDGWPDSKLAPIDELARAYRQIFSRKGRWQMMGYGNSLGDPGFREALVQMLNFKRGLRISTEQLCVTRGSQMATYMAAQCLIEKGDYVLVENPGYKPAWEALRQAGAELLPVSVDEEGLIVAEIEKYLKRHKRIKAIFTTPHHQFPTTVTLSLQRRAALISLSNQHGFTIIEDDYDNEFHFGQRPILPLSSYENIQNYVYIGSLSKVVAPALRIGYLVSNKDFIKKVSLLRKIIDVQGDSIMEHAVLQLINDGEIKRHLRRATAYYKGKRDFFEALVQEHLQDKVVFRKPEGGLAFWLALPKKTNVNQLADKLLMQSVQILPPENFSFKETIPGLRLGYCSLTEKQIREGIITIGKFL